MKKLTIKKLKKFLEGKNENSTIYLSNENWEGYVSDDISYNEDENEIVIGLEEEPELKRVILKDKLIYDFNNEKYKLIDEKKINELIEDINGRIDSLGVVYGEFGNSGVLDTSLSHVSHSITKKLKLVDKKIYGDIQILRTKNGKRAMTLLNRIGEEKLKFSIRAIGATNENGDMEIQKIFTFDIIK